MTAYWDALLRGNRSGAAEYVEPVEREAFFSRPVPPFTEPRLASLEISETGAEATVTVMVTRRFIPLPDPVSFPVTQRWVLQEGRWYALEPPPGTPFIIPASARPLEPEEAQRRQTIVRGQLRFEDVVLDFGTLRKGGSASRTVRYELEGMAPMTLDGKSLPAGLEVRGLEGGNLAPGRGRHLEFVFHAGEPDGKIEQAVTVTVRHLEVEVPYEFLFRAYVYTPVSVRPASLSFGKEERERDVVVTNNSGVAVRLQSAKSESQAFSVQKLPLTLPPGKSGTLKIRLVQDVQEKNRAENITVVFRGAVEGVTGLSIPVLINPEKQRQNPLGLTEEELLRKARGLVKPPG